MRIFFILILLSFLLMTLLGCNSEKHVAKTTVNKDSLALVEKDKMIASLTNEVAHYKKKVGNNDQVIVCG